MEELEFALRGELPKGILCRKIEQTDMISAGILLPVLCLGRFILLLFHCSWRIVKKGKVSSHSAEYRKECLNGFH